MKTIMVESLDKNKKTEILAEIENQKNSVGSKKEVSIDLDSANGNYDFSLQIAESAIRNKIKINAEGRGSLDASSAFILALAKQTGGRSAAFYNSKFQLVETIGNEEKKSQLKNIEAKNNNIIIGLKSLRCNAKYLDGILNSGEIISADQAKKIGIIDEVISIKLPKKKKKGGNQNDDEKDENDQGKNAKDDKSKSDPDKSTSDTLNSTKITDTEPMNSEKNDEMNTKKSASENSDSDNMVDTKKKNEDKK